MTAEKFQTGATSFSVSGSTASGLLLFLWDGGKPVSESRPFSRTRNRIGARKMKACAFACTLDNALRRCTKRGHSAAVAFASAAFGVLSACEQNTFVPPPPPKVDVAVPVQRAVTRYLEATGNTAPIKSVDLVARVQGFLQSIDYQDGTFVKEGTHAVHDRARDLQAQARAGAGGGGRRAGHAEAGRGRFQAAGRPGAAPGGLAGDARQLHLHPRQRAGQSAAGPGQHQARGGQLRLYQGDRAVRRRRQRAPGLRSANSSASSSPTQLATIVALDPI